jgi:hypothetical protein
VFVAVAIGALVLAHLFDLLSFVEMIGRHGLDAELNPLVVYLHGIVGVPGLAMAKAISVGIGASVFVILAPHRRRLAMSVLLFGVGAGLLGGVSNVATW